MRKLYKLSFFLSLISSFIFISGNDRTIFSDKDRPFAPITIDAADSILSKMTLEQKIGQFFILSKPNEEYEIDPAGYLLSNITDPMISNNSTADIPMMFGVSLTNVDQKSPRSGLASPFQLASVKDKQLVKDYAYAFGESLKMKGIDFVIGPSLDIEVNDLSPYASQWSLGAEVNEVQSTASAIVEGFQMAGLSAVVGNFPGLGSTDRGYETSPSIIYAKRHELNNRDLVPFKALINQGIQSVLVSNAFAPGLDSSLNTIASVSPIINATLRNQMGFNGLIWADLTCAGNKNLEERVNEAFLAGNELIVIDTDLEKSIGKIEALIEQGAITLEEIDIRCKKVIQSKLWLKRKKAKRSVQDSLRIEKRLELKHRQVYSDGLVMVRNSRGLIPIQHLDTLKIALVKIGNSTDENLNDLANRYARTVVYPFNYNSLEADFQKFQKDANQFNLVLIIADAETNEINRKRFDLSEHCQSVIDRISQQKTTALLWNGNAKALRYLSQNIALDAVIIGHEANKYSDDLGIQALFGGRPISGELRRNIDDIFTADRVSESGKIRLAYGLPEEVGISSFDLKKIDSIAKKGISEMAYPGCQLWFAKDGIVVMNEAYGYHTYQTEQAVKQSDLYDLASITKIAGSVAGLMKLSDQGSFNLDYRLCDYLSDWVDTTSYMQLTMREILAHQAGLTPFIPFYSRTITKGVPRYDVYSLAQSDTYPLRVAREFYIRGDYPDKMFRQILNYKLSEEKKYKYSDIGYYFALRIIERQTGMPMNEFLDESFYKPLGLSTMGYRPLERFDKDQITPTEFDRIFRNQLIQGDVHDPGAAMLGGVGGHAGLFSNANDLGILMQMYLNKGVYGGQQFFKPEIIDEYTKCQFCENDNRRGAGFDKPTTDRSPGPSCGCTDLEAFGHQGFTGTVTWADPGENVVYVFLSNRIYPDAGNKKLQELNIRTDIQGAFYKAIEKGKDLASE